MDNRYKVMLKWGAIFYVRRKEEAYICLLYTSDAADE